MSPIIALVLIFLVLAVVAHRLDCRREWRNTTDLERRAIGDSKRFEGWWHRWLNGRPRRLSLEDRHIVELSPRDIPPQPSRAAALHQAKSLPAVRTACTTTPVKIEAA